MTDLHCHILPGIDDGAHDEGSAEQMLSLEVKEGVDRIALTSHFDCETEETDRFVEARDRAFEKLFGIVTKNSPAFNKIEFKKASEVLFSPKLAELDLKPLCIEGTPYILIEFPSSRRPFFLRETLYRIQGKGFVPVIAHVERYSFATDDLKTVKSMVDAGIYFQVNAQPLYSDRKKSKFLMKLIEWNLVHVIASDAHSPKDRAPNLMRGMDAVAHALGEDAVSRLKENADAIFRGAIPEPFNAYEPKKVFGKWK